MGLCLRKIPRIFRENLNYLSALHIHPLHLPSQKLCNRYVMYYRITAILQLSSRRLHRFPVAAYCTFRYSIVLVIAYFSNVFTVIAIILNLPVFRILILINQLPCKTRLICVNSRKIPILLVLRATFAIISAAHCYTAFSSSQ